MAFLEPRGLMLGRDRDAIPEYKTTLELQPDLYAAELNLALSLMRSPRGDMLSLELSMTASPTCPEKTNLTLLYGRTRLS